MRVYTPALKEYVRLCRESDIAERADALIDFVNGGVYCASTVSIVISPR